VPKNGAAIGVGTDAASARCSARTLPEMVTRFCRSFQPGRGPDRYQVYTRRNGLLHKVGGG
jgi:hypothetical protein